MGFRLGMAAALAALALSGPALAQSTTPAPAAPAAPDPVRLQLARQLVNAQGGADTYKSQIGSMFTAVSKMVKSSVPAAQADLVDTMFKYIADEETDAVPQMMTDVADVYAERLTERELRDMLAWADSDSGRSIRDKMPAITQELLLRQQPLMKKLVAGMMQKAVDRTCAEQHCTDQQRQTLAAIVANFAPPAS